MIRPRRSVSSLAGVGGLDAFGCVVYNTGPMAYLEFHRLIIVWALASIRIGAAFMMCPAFAESMITGTARRVAILAFSVLVVPHVLATMPEGEPNALMMGVVGVKEVLIGFLIGFFAAVPFWVAENVGNLIDNQRGATMGEVYSPMSGSQESTTGLFFTQIVSTIFFVSGAVFLLLGALYTSFDLFPVFGRGVSFVSDAPLRILGAVDGMLRTTVVIAAPIVILMVLASIGLGFVNRTAPQLNVFFLSMPVKSALGVAMLVIYLPFIIDKLMYTKEGDLLGPVLKLLGF